MMARQILTSIVVALMLYAPAAAQSDVDPLLAAAIRNIKAGDYLNAVFTLNDAVSQLSGKPGTALARVHAYRAEAYIGLNQTDRAMAAAVLAMRADPQFVPSAPEFSPAVVKLFADPAGFAAGRAAESAPKPEPERRAAAAPAPAAIAPAAIYVYFPKYKGRAAPKVLCDGSHVADLGGQRFVLLHVPAGTHGISFGGGRALSAAMVEGQDYYFRALMAGHIMVGPGLALANADEARAEMRDQALTANDPGHTYSSDCKAVAQTRKK